MAWRERLVRRTSVPALLIAYAVLALGLAALFAGWTVDAAQAGRAVAADRRCATDDGGPCLDEGSGTLIGPHPIRRSVNQEWHVAGTADDGRFEVGPRASSGLDPWAGDQVTALTFRGDLVVIATPDGSTYESLNVGVRGAAMSGCATAALGAGVVGLVRHAVRRRRAAGGWWRVGGPAVDATDLPVAVAVVAPALCVALMLFGAPWWVAGATVLATAGAVAMALYRGVRHLRDHPPRHALGSE